MKRSNEAELCQIRTSLRLDVVRGSGIPSPRRLCLVDGSDCGYRIYKHYAYRCT